MAQRETSAEIDLAAADWAVRVDHAPLDPETQAALDAWLEGESRRLGAYARARAMLVHAKRAKALGPDFDPDDFLAASASDPLDLATAQIDESNSRSDGELDFAGEGHRPTRRKFLWWGGSAAVAAGVAGMIGFSYQAAARTYTTKRGEIRLIPLADGSSMTLNTESTAKVSYDDATRRVDLVEGEALFDVVHDTHRPFIVSAGDTNVHAVGTSFSVSRLPNKPVQVTVRQGVVEVVQPKAGKATRERLMANTQATIAPTPTSSAAPVEIETRKLPPAEISRTLAWREGMLSFEDMPLSQAADQFARYSDTRIRFADPSIGSETVTGLFAANNPTGFAKAVATSLDLRAATTPGGIVLRR